MTDREHLISRLKEHNALLEGHFMLSSGRRSRQYVQFARIHEYPEAMKEFSRLLMDKIRTEYSELRIDCIVSPAIGGVVPGYQLTCDLGIKRYIFCERNKESIFEFRRNFEIVPGENYLIVEDVVTTGGSFIQVADLVEAAGGNVVLITSFIDRTGGKKFKYPYLPLISLNIDSYNPDELPEDLKLIQPIKPGSNNKIAIKQG
jgi:orotate phosphoribosyltransferase